MPKFTPVVVAVLALVIVGLLAMRLYGEFETQEQRIERQVRQEQRETRRRQRELERATDELNAAERRLQGPRACQTYVPSVRHCLRFQQADALGRSLDAVAYAERYCSCEHPLDVLLERQVGATGTAANGRRQRAARSRTNTWHYLLSRRQEVEAFSTHPAAVPSAQEPSPPERSSTRTSAERRPSPADETRHA